MNIIIDKPRKEDVRGIQDVFFKTWLSTYPNREVGITLGDIEEKFKNRHSENSIQKRILEIESNFENRIFLVAKDSEKVIGLCKAIINDDFNQLEAIYVLPDYQRHGTGKMFWARCLEFFNNKKEIIIHVADYNKQAINFYEKLGFVYSGKRFSDEKYKMPISGKIIPEIEMIMKIKKVN